MRKAFKNVHEFIDCLEKEGELLRIQLPVSPVLEITEIADRASKSPDGGKALFFENVEDSDFPVLINALGSKKRIALALGCKNLDSLAQRLQNILEQQPPQTFLEKMKFLPHALEWSRYLPKLMRKGRAACQEIIMKGNDVDLSKLPVLHCWPKDGGKFVTLPVVFTKGLHDGKRNAGMYRMQIYDRNTTGMHWHVHKDGSHHYNEYKKAGKTMEVAVAIGTDPAVTYAATAPMPRGIDEMLLAGFIRQSPVEMVKGITVDIEVPAEAEFVLEGYVNPHELRTEGPFGDHTGYYSLQDDYPVFHVTAITHRAKPIYSATVVGRPPMEDCYLALATERLFLPAIKTVMPEIKDYWMPWEGVFHNIVAIAIDKEYPQHARKVINGLWGLGQMSFAKAVVVIDNPEYLKDGKLLLHHILDTIDCTSDITITEGILDVLDHSAPQPLYGSKIGIDATRRVSNETPRESYLFKKPISDTLILSSLKQRDTDFLAVRTIFPDSYHSLFLVSINKTDNKNSNFFINKLKNIKDIMTTAIVVLYDAPVNLHDNSLLLWKVFNNVDPVRDIKWHQGGGIVDATRKNQNDGHTRPWPDDIAMPQKIKEKIDMLNLDVS